MVEVEIRSPVYDEEEGRIAWRALALVRADGDELSIYQEKPVIDVAMRVLDVATGKSVSAADEPKAWVRSLPFAYRAGDLVAVLLVDSDDVADPPHPGDCGEAAAPQVPAPRRVELAFSS